MHAERPRLCRGLVLVPAHDGFLIAGGPRRHYFRGKVAAKVLPSVLSLLDGTREEQEIARELGLDQRRLAQMVAMLRARGLLESDTTAAVPSSQTEQVATYLSRNGTRELGDALATTAVHVAGDEPVAQRVVEDLRDCGVGSVSTSRAAPEGADADRLLLANRPLVVVLDGATNSGLLEKVVDWCASRDIPVLRLALNNGHIEVGPCFQGQALACVDCLRRGVEQATWDAELGTGDDLAETLAGLAAAEAFTIVGRFPHMRAAHILTRISIDSWSAEDFLVAPYPDCPACWSGETTADEETFMAEIYEWSERQRPGQLAEGAQGPALDEEWLEELKGQRSDFSSHPRVPLANVPARDGLGALAAVARQVAGLRADPDGLSMQRWAPAAGNMASVELYLITEAGVPGLPGTIFWYADLPDEFVAVRPDPYPLSQVLAGTDLDAGRLAAALVFVAATGRIAGKYQTLNLRLAHLDAGCATTQLAAVTRSLGLSVTFASTWDERLPGLLGLAKDHFIVTAVAGIGPPEGGL
ncbi:nitroreductase family protein [Nonomuraea sp. LPB2021202275-12-8]|uniref:nitroreductase family protein n=1 Tax=Nonomuraea sp. LPB2021202275-12-8 TaxID=3120159 RepID=UPI00300DB0A0